MSEPYIKQEPLDEMSHEPFPDLPANLLPGCSDLKPSLDGYIDEPDPRLLLRGRSMATLNSPPNGMLGYYAGTSTYPALASTTAVAGASTSAPTVFGPPPSGGRDPSELFGGAGTHYNVAGMLTPPPTPPPCGFNACDNDSCPAFKREHFSPDQRLSEIPQALPPRVHSPEEEGETYVALIQPGSIGLNFCPFRDLDWRLKEEHTEDRTRESTVIRHIDPQDIPRQTIEPVPSEETRATPLRELGIENEPMTDYCMYDADDELPPLLQPPHRHDFYRSIRAGLQDYHVAGFRHPGDGNCCRNTWRRIVLGEGAPNNDIAGPNRTWRRVVLGEAYSGYYWR